MSGTVQHSTATMRQVRDLAEGDWTPSQIRSILEGRGVEPPSLTTIYLWTTPDYAQRHREACRQRAELRTARASGGRIAPRSRSAAYRETRIRALRAAGLGFGTIAAVMRLDFQDGTTAREVRSVLQDMPRGRLA